MKSIVKGMLGLCALVIFAQPAHAYQFLCAGYRITGTSGQCPVGTLDQDTECGCTVTTAPKWASGAVSFKAENQGGNGISAHEFVQAVQSAGEQWSSVSCSTVLIAYGGAVSSTNSARWGNHNNLSQEQGVFYVQSQSEWIEVTGSGAGNTLGVTVSPYYTGWNCNNREFADTDILINGFLEGGMDYSTLQATILHEMGHSIGLDHPCLTTNPNCNNSCSAVMAGTGADFSIPQQDDVNGVCALYPGVSGGLGSACSGDGDCTSGSCITYEGFRYCSQSCGSGCPTGYECKTVNNQQVCVRKGLPGVGEPCTSTCVDGAICVGSEGSGTCYQECNPLGSGHDCSTGQSCVELQVTGGPAKGICLAAGGPGDDCELTDGVCVDGHVCVHGVWDGYRCRQECSAGTSDNCPEGQRCRDLQNSSGQSTGGACFPEGTSSEGESCSSAMDCAEGLLCISTFSGAMCMWECDPQNPDCPHEGQTCSPLSGGTGICEPVSGSSTDEGNNSGSGENGGTTPGSGNNGGQTNPGTVGGQNSPACYCDTTTICDDDCACDPECVCYCDATTVCDANCDCDPECGESSFWSCSGTKSTRAPIGEVLLLLVAFGGVLLLRRRT